MYCLVHGVTKSRTRLSDFHFLLQQLPIVLHVEETTMKHRTMMISCVCVCVCIRDGGVLVVRSMSFKEVEKGPDGRYFVCMKLMLNLWD